MAPDEDDLFSGYQEPTMPLNAGIGSWVDVPEAIHVPTGMSVNCVVDQKAKVEGKEKGKVDPQEAQQECPQAGHAADQQTDLQEDVSGKDDLQEEKQERLHEELDILLQTDHQGHHMAHACHQVARTGDPHIHHHTLLVADGSLLRCTPGLLHQKEARKEIGQKENQKGKVDQDPPEQPEAGHQKEDLQVAKTIDHHAKPLWQVIVVPRHRVVGGIQRCAVSSQQEGAQKESNAPTDTQKVRHTETHQYPLVSRQGKGDQKDQQQ